jgi:hypothetical protein
MKNGHVRRTKTPAPEPPSRRKRLLLASLIVPIILVIPAVAFVVAPPEPEGIETVIRQAGFNPLTPPNRLRAPGALYLVEESGFYEKVCEDGTLTAAHLKTSPTLNRNLQRLEKGGFTLAGSIIDSLNGKLSGARVTSIEYRLTDVAISEIAGDHLAEIQTKLLENKHCSDEVEQLLKANKRVCAGASAISATTSYRVRVDRKFESGTPEKDAITKAVQKSIEEHAGGLIQVRSEDELAGENLFVGIRLKSLCVAPGTATEPIPLPATEQDKTAARTGSRLAGVKRQ